jgi:hypothetical protein
MAQHPKDPVDVFLNSLLPHFNDDLFNFGTLDAPEASPVDEMLDDWSKYVSNIFEATKVDVIFRFRDLKSPIDSFSILVPFCA